MRTLVLGMLLLAAESPAHGAARCACIANGQRVEEGQVACIRPQSGGSFLAKCEIVLNNTSWTKLQDGCPTASIDAKLSRPVSGIAGLP